MAETIPLYTPTQFITDKLNELNTRMRTVQTIIKNKTAPAGMVWDPTLNGGMGDYRGWNWTEQQAFNAWMSGVGPKPDFVN